MGGYLIMNLRVLLCAFFLCLFHGLSWSIDEQESREEFQNNILTPDENLMRAHGILNRILLIYDELARRINNRIAFPAETLHDTALIAHAFIEEFHEEMEEKYVFSYFEKKKISLELISTLREDHKAGRKMTQYLLKHSTESELKSEEAPMVLAVYMNLFCRMFRVHEARESSELFPIFPLLMTRDEYLALGSLFEKKEDEIIGPHGYEQVLKKITTLEKQLSSPS